MTSSNGNIFRVTGPLCGEFPGEFPAHKGQWRGPLMFSLICVWINGWVNNREAGDSRRNQAHYDVIVMFYSHGCVQDCSISSALAMETPQSCTEPSIYHISNSDSSPKGNANFWTIKTWANVAFINQGTHRWPVNSPHIRPVTRKMFPFDDVIMRSHHSKTIELSYSLVLAIYIKCLRKSDAHADRRPGARPTNDISTEFKIRPKFGVLYFKIKYT